jgi:hypothetical protein
VQLFDLRLAVGYSPPLVADTGREIEVHRYPKILVVAVRAQSALLS